MPGLSWCQVCPGARCPLSLPQLWLLRGIDCPVSTCKYCKINFRNELVRRAINNAFLRDWASVVIGVLKVVIYNLWSFVIQLAVCVAMVTRKAKSAYIDWVAKISIWAAKSSEKRPPSLVSLGYWVLVLGNPRNNNLTQCQLTLVNRSCDEWLAEHSLYWRVKLIVNWLDCQYN